ncbi:hypothetical protein H2204_000183 [Knufia peltigerae]|uniref:Methyltransferase n=1 Tax=Knufia peltigerae TaxID=1002370 RepID=A0AA38YFF1_9EURO|nr:hypothetical protein H2204_000183 [Knufia peltigerae]
MSTSEPHTKPHYPGPRDLSESKRLKAQSDLVTAAFGELVLCPIDLTAAGLRILDSGTADGLFLRQLHSLLAQPESATLIGTDIAPFEDNVGKPDYVEWQKQDINEEWPASWQNTFDFVHQRAVIANAGSWDGAVKAVTRLAKLVKPGAWVQLVDSTMQEGDILESDPPSLKFTKAVGSFLKKFGLFNRATGGLSEILAQTNEIIEIGQKEAALQLGVLAKNEKLKEAGRIWLSSMRYTIDAALARVNDPNLISLNDWNKLMDEVELEAETAGVEFKWWAAWGKRKATV